MCCIETHPIVSPSVHTYNSLTSTLRQSLAKRAFLCLSRLFEYNTTDTQRLQTEARSVTAPARYPNNTFGSW
jgi:hypothetical protein